MGGTHSHEVSFFKPTSEHGKANKKLIIALVIIWIVCVFGFQALLILFAKPTPEANLISFETAWSGAAQSGATETVQKTLARTFLAVLGKNIAISADHKKVLKESLSATVLSLVPADQKAPFQETLAQNPSLAVTTAIQVIGLSGTGFDKIMANLLPSSLVPVASEEISAENKTALPAIMKLYCTHNQCGLTTMRFLGFPFHYWYTAQFLLILFVGLCLIYAIMIGRINRKFKFIEE
ncbi:MAG: hypothetical protein A2268_10720 [Candidatus Raymondbacteria bacterium RifOxyA12_full_50_37]|uniref:Sodium symporter small subunit domain-containing protein n=1 Tax=Candidatus Raymondbacteria bacterium RIFOXYD12_FULL_49_13 TaxID=1817890 RepID=A0A1F7F954_UNCRA|nr:MAG: hypothetical protein A2268_10720 [Candidatus Raymondbacteria bacterium RifOxyA12_full_50_37]OGJ85437.1 MAG: hypothetical protein A2248_12505 [Candidatus Raymondbacteria bacterium RIFOXYA2_FULL_49_16]OGJ91043.1 MAG: hypothetical protein A2350_07405 [Candidatus Raymondbacteria bacterium RifOxyB12_full_50_8]OGJ94945.1 MAG: hypothetical protein A2453_07975 [Candidatus Raymondbacteria bacterium RIFOXYC2_FULL_50_21]OGK03062.1 MAG: hypothetical protein A2519_21460 [Candidatus Raymondbacteria b